MDVPTGLWSASPASGGIKAHMLNVVLRELPSDCQNSFREAVARGKFRSMPNSFLPPSEQKVPGLLFLGDALNMRHPLTGGGMTVALNDVLLISKLLSPENVRSLDDSNALLEQIGRFHWGPEAEFLPHQYPCNGAVHAVRGPGFDIGCFEKWVFSILSNWWEVQARALRYAGGSYTGLRGFLFIISLLSPSILSGLSWLRRLSG